jgi:uncharacterized protein
LHYLEPDQQTAVLEKAMKQLLPGGKVIIREGNTEMTEQHKKTKLTELFSTRIFGFNKTESGKLYFLSAAKIRTIAAANGFDCRDFSDSNLTSNSMYILMDKHNTHGSAV